MKNSDTTETSNSSCIDTNTEFTIDKRTTVYKLLEVANTALINAESRNQTAIDALSIATAIVKNPDTTRTGINTVNIPDGIVPPETTQPTTSNKDNQ